MIRIKQAVIVEGKYDVIKLSSIIDGVILKTDGFGIFKDKQQLELIKMLAKKTGIIILTDSDVAGFKIRSFIKSTVREGEIINVYIPDVLGKERRKSHSSKEGKLGVEGVEKEIILTALEKAGVNEKSITTSQDQRKKITKTDLFELGLSGCENSSVLRQRLLKRMDLPERLTTNSLLSVLNVMLDYEELVALISPVNN